MIILGEDGLRSQYVPPKPTVKILKRPTRDSRGSGDGPLNDDKPKQPIKSLKQVCNIVSLSLILLNTQEYKKIISERAGICRSTKKDPGRGKKPGGKNDARGQQNSVKVEYAKWRQLSQQCSSYACWSGWYSWF